MDVLPHSNLALIRIFCCATNGSALEKELFALSHEVVKFLWYGSFCHVNTSLADSISIRDFLTISQQKATRNLFTSCLLLRQLVTKGNSQQNTTPVARAAIMLPFSLNVKQKGGKISKTLRRKKILSYVKLLQIKIERNTFQLRNCIIVLIV